MEYEQNFCCRRIKSKVACPTGSDLGLRGKETFSCYKAPHVTCPGFQASCSLFCTFIPAPARSCEGIAGNQDFWPSVLSSWMAPCRVSSPWKTLGTVLWQKLLNPSRHRMFPAKERPLLSSASTPKITNLAAPTGSQELMGLGNHWLQEKQQVVSSSAQERPKIQTAPCELATQLPGPQKTLAGPGRSCSSPRNAPPKIPCTAYWAGKLCVTTRPWLQHPSHAR